MTARAVERRIEQMANAATRSREEEFDGCCAAITDVSRSDATARQVWERYGDLQRVERDFRTLKTGLLELRPIFLGKAGWTRAHALVAVWR